jgi:hypothetical protein
MERNKLNFNQALSALEDGLKVAREGWDEQKLWLYYSNGVLQASALAPRTSEELVNTLGDDGRVTALAFGGMVRKSVEGTFKLLGLPNLNVMDVIAEDWAVVK